ncbi:MAG: hypothetical protein FWC32_01300 [Firmicutes bacterium]|nr:hypothetical protein [Bacillota bacterium]
MKGNLSKKFFVLALLLVAAFALSACNRGGPGAGDGTYEWDEEGRFRVFDDVHLTFRSVWNGGRRMPADQINNPVATQIRDRIGVTVTLEGIMMNETEHLNLMFASMDFPDMFNAPFWGGHGGETGVIKRAIADGLLFDIGPYLELFPNIQRAYEIGVISQLYYERDIRDPMFTTGGTYILPQQTPGSAAHITNWGNGLFVRGDVPAALGFNPEDIRTQEQLLDVMRRARDHGFYDIHGNPVMIIGSNFHDGWGFGSFLEGFSRQAWSPIMPLPDGTWTHADLTERWVEEHLFMWRLVNEGLYDVEGFRHTGDQANEKVGNGRVLFAGPRFDTIFNATNLTGMYNTNPEMRFVPMGPFYDWYGSPMVQFESYGRTGSPAIFFPYNTRNILAALTWIDYLNTPEGLELVSYGIEGVTFQRNAQGQPRLMPEILERRLAGDDRWREMMLDVGASYLDADVWFADNRIYWFGEREPGAEGATIPGLDEWRARRPIVRRAGWPIGAFESQFDRIDLVRQTFWDGNPQRDFRERAYFAPTEEAAREILEGWQDFLRTGANGVFMDFIEFMGQQYNRRPDVVWGPGLNGRMGR